MANSSKRGKVKIPRRLKTTGLQSAKPFADFPLYAHKSGRWAKKITVNGKAKLYYFGKVSDGWEDALKRFEAEKVDIYAGRAPTSDAKSDGVKLLDLCNAFMHEKNNKAERGAMTWRSFNEYRTTLEVLLDTVGRTVIVEKLKPVDFHPFTLALSKRFGAVSQTNQIVRVRSVFKYGLTAGILDKPVSFGEQLALPGKRQKRLEKAKKPVKLFEAREIRRMLRNKMGNRLANPVQLRAMILLGINCGLGNDDCGRLTFSALDMRGGWCNLHRNKTGIERRAKLWPETVAALTAAVDRRPIPKDVGDRDLVFITKYGGRWFKEATAAKNKTDNPVATQTAKIMHGAAVERKGRGFYCLRHTFFTIASNGGDQVAASYVMGHINDDIASVYRHRIDDSRLSTVAAIVRQWLFRRDSQALWRPLQR